MLKLTLAFLILINDCIGSPYLVTYVGNTVRTSDSQKLASWGVPGYAPDNDYNIINLAFWTTTLFSGVGRQPDGFTWGADGWENIGSYLGSQTKRTLTGLSNPSDNQVRAAIVERFHNAGKKLMVSAFGATDHPIQRGGNARSIGTQIGNVVKKYGLDGVDIDNEETAYLRVNGVGAAWLCDLTNAIRAVLPKSQGYLISHAPQAPYFGTGYDYRRIHQTCGGNIDFYNVQFYNQGNERYNTYQNMYVATTAWATGSNINAWKNIVGLDKIVIGKCAPGGCGATVHEMSGTAIKNLIQTAINNNNKPAGFMVWELIREKNTNFAMINAVSPLFPTSPTAPTTRPAPSPVTLPTLAPPTVPPPTGTGGGRGCVSGSICFKVAGMSTYWIGILNPTNILSGCSIKECSDMSLRISGTNTWIDGYYDTGANKCAFSFRNPLSSNVRLDVKLTSNNGQTLISTNVIQSTAAGDWNFNNQFNSCSNVNTPSAPAPTQRPSPRPTAKPATSPIDNNSGETLPNIKIKLYWGSGSYYLAFFSDFTTTIPNGCSVSSVNARMTGTTAWATCTLSGSYYTCSGQRFYTGGDISIDIRITASNGFSLIGYNVIKGFKYGIEYDFGSNFKSNECFDRSIATDKIKAFDFNNYNVKSWGVFISVLIAILCLIIGIVLYSCYSMKKIKTTQKDFEIQNALQSTMKSNTTVVTLTPMINGITQGNIKTVNDSDSDDIISPVNTNDTSQMNTTQ